MERTSLKEKLQDNGALIALILLFVILATLSPEFRTMGNLLSLLRQASINGLIAFGMTCVILTGGIDLSVGSTLALCAALSAGMIVGGLPAVLAVLIALVLGTLFGTVNGIMVAKGRLQPFIATLISMTVYRGVTYIYTNGQPISNLGNSAFLKTIGRGSVIDIPVPVIILLVVFVVIYFVLQKTSFGRAIYATGSNETCAKLAGISISKTKIAVYAISGFMSALAGMILLSRLGSAQPTLGSGYELDAIASVALGGTSMNGGRGRITGTLIGVLIIAALNNGLNILGVSSYYQDVVKGIVILIAVLSDRSR